jgi:hypothetical protein
MPIRRFLVALPVLLALSACGEDATPVASVSTRPQNHAPTHSPPPRRLPPPSARVLALPGLEGVIGVHADDLSRLFGPPRLDIQEGDARKLQFVGTSCVLDVYLYPPKAGGAPQSTYIDARRAADAREVDRAACVTALRRR